MNPYHRGKWLILTTFLLIIVHQQFRIAFSPSIKASVADVSFTQSPTANLTKGSTLDALQEAAFQPDAEGFYRMDQVGPKVIYAKTHYFRSLPQEYRFPQVHLSNLSHYFQETQRSRKKKYYWEYNPSLVPLPSSQVPLYLNASEEYYLGVYRISNQQGCFTTEQMRPNPKDKSYNVNLGDEGPVDMLGFAVLSTSLDIVAETVVTMMGRDFRLFRHGDQIYLTRDTGFWELWLRPHAKNQLRDRVELNPFVINEKNGFPVYTGYRNYCCASQYCKGKNYNYFVDSQGRLMADTRSMSPRIVEGIKLKKRNTCLHTKTFQPPITEHNYTLASNTSYPLYVTSTVPPESFHTADESYFLNHNVKQLPYTEERGTACCIRIPNMLRHTTIDPDYLLVGVSHTKITKWQDGLLKTHNVSFTLRQYNSRFYAFEPVPPYRVMAQSGRFCMPYPSTEEAAENPNLPLIRNIPFVIGTNYSCPYITFVMGMIETVDDPNTVLISYGMNDCGARVAKVSKTEISRMLFPAYS
jgi:hypothetical protein